MKIGAEFFSIEKITFEIKKCDKINEEFVCV